MDDLSDAGTGDDPGGLVGGVAHRPESPKSVGQGSVHGEAGVKWHLEVHASWRVAKGWKVRSPRMGRRAEGSRRMISASGSLGRPRLQVTAMDRRAKRRSSGVTERAVIGAPSTSRARVLLWV